MALVYKNPHQESFRAAERELAQLSAEAASLRDRLAWIEARAHQLTEYMNAARPLLEEDPGSVAAAEGLTAICRSFLLATGAWMTAQTIRNQLSYMGIDISGYTNPMAVLHATLKRIGDMKKGTDGETYYGARGLANNAPYLDSNSGYRHAKSITAFTAPPPGFEKKKK